MAVFFCLIADNWPFMTDFQQTIFYLLTPEVYLYVLWIFSMKVAGCSAVW
jgi:hypothetical protein